MWQILICLLLIQHLEIVSTSVQSVGIVHNVSVKTFIVNSTIVNGTCHECLCAVLSNRTSSFFFNCFSNNSTCEMFVEPLIMGSFVVVDNAASSFYFLSWPIKNTISGTSEYRFLRIKYATRLLELKITV